MNRRLSAGAAALALAFATPALAGDWVDTRLSFAFADDNVLAAEGETTPSSPSARFGAGAQNTLFFDNVNTRFSGFETLSNLTLYKSTPAFFEGLNTEAALSIVALERFDGTINLRDNSSYVRLNYRPLSWGEKDGISFTGFPVSADRFRLGYAYRITWGGNGVFTTRAQQFGVPGARLQINKQFNDDQGVYVFVGAKSGLILNDITREQRTNYGVLGGGGVDVHKYVRLDISAGYFQKGTIPGLADRSIEAYVNQAGASAQLVFHVGTPVGTSIDLRLYKNDPDVYERLFRPETYDPGGPASLSISLEGSHLAQTLGDPDSFGDTVVQTAQAAALIGRVKKGYARFNVTALYRTVSFIQNEVPGFPPFNDFPDGTELQPEIFGSIGVDYHLPRAHVTPGLILGVQQPAAYTGATGLGGNVPDPALLGRRTVVFRDTNLVSILRAGDKSQPILAGKLTFRWDLSDTVAAIGETYVNYDNNRTNFRDDVTGVVEPVYEKPLGIGFNAVLQARF